MRIADQRIICLNGTLTHHSRTYLISLFHFISMYQIKNKSVVNASYNTAVLHSTSGNIARNDTPSQLTYVSLTSAQFQHRLWSGIAVTIVTIGAPRSSCHQSVPVPATSARSRGVTQKCLFRLGTNRA